MLDLNLNVASSDSVADKLLHHHFSTSQMESSGSLNSSNVTADDDDSSNVADNAFAYTFGILKHNDGDAALGRPVGAYEDYGGARTIQLFPTTATVRSPGSSSGRQWLGLSSSCAASYDSPAEQRIVTQRTVKKTRRGPRSRSSQYRGVTFYRRTGRWESHIWLVFDSEFLLEIYSFNIFAIHIFGFPLCSFFLLCVCVCRDCGKQVYLGKQESAQPLCFWFSYTNCHFLVTYLIIIVVILFTGNMFLVGGFDTAHAAAR